MAYTSSILIVSAEPVYQQELAAELKSLGARAVFCESVGQAKDLLKRGRFDLAFCAAPECTFRISARESDFGERQIPIVMVSRKDDWASYLNAMSAGAFDYIVTPLQAGEVGRVLKAALGTSASASRVVTGQPGAESAENK